MPHAVEVKQGQEYWLCVCGKSPDGLCNGSHEGSGKSPRQFVAEQDETLYICGCGQSFNSPFCDGTHKTLSLTL
ncbi:CDGSH iron-sulfur domain-containing protein [Ferrovum sp.]|uniref:CDGSH iron-sulfur domain-containing protein n=1 Tax=Ferrovum sp. TaxID=2609467 RepID=UPI00262E60AA|nr:CDGSH iron-sulfur domain-containing protein [Ferrovum sp.]